MIWRKSVAVMEGRLHDPYDWVVGPIADDGLAFLFKMFERGYYTLGEVLRKMQFKKKLTTQYSFHTQKALSLLIYREVRRV